MTRTFPNTGEPFSGLLAAQAWCRENRHAYGPQQRNAPIGVRHVDEGEAFFIPKWRGLTKGDRDVLDGRLESASFRTGAVLLVLTGGPAA